MKLFSFSFHEKKSLNSIFMIYIYKGRRFQTSIQRRVEHKKLTRITFTSCYWDV